MMSVGRATPLKGGIVNFDTAYEKLVSSWLRHEDLKAQGADIEDLFEARVALDKARYGAAVASHR